MSPVAWSTDRTSHGASWRSRPSRVLLWRERGELVTPPRAALVASGALAVVAALAELVLPDLAAAAIAMLAVGTVLVHALRRPATALVVLLLLALPIIASLQFYLGYPLRLLVAHASALLLSILESAPRPPARRSCMTAPRC